MKIKSTLRRFNQNTNDNCPLCYDASKTVEHLFIRCKYMHAMLMSWKGGILLQKFDRLDILSFLHLCLKPPTALIPKNEGGKRILL